MNPAAQEILAAAVRELNRGDLAAAAAAGEALLRAGPADAGALGVLGLVALRRRQAAAAAGHFARAVSLRPEAPLLRCHLGEALASIRGREGEAIAAFRAALTLDPQLADAHHHLGNLLKRLGRFDEAIVSLREAARLAPANALPWLNLGVAQLERGAAAEAVGSFHQAVRIAPGRPEAHNVLGAALLESGRVTEAERSFSVALALRPGYAAAHHNRARALKMQARLAEAVVEYRTALAAAADPGTHSNLVYALNFASGLAPEGIAAEHKAWAARHAEPLTAAARGGDRRPAERTGARDRAPAEVAGRRLRVGFVSPDLVNHAVAYFLEPLLANRPGAEWSSCCYSDAPVPDRVTQRLRRLSDTWRDTATWTDEQLDAQIRRDRIDVLVDLAGHTGRNRLLVFARCPAPVQVTWLGYPNTTGLSAMHYRITDAICDPPGRTEAWHSETLWRLPRVFLVYRPPAASPPVAAVPAATGGPVTFGSFNNFAKVSDDCLETWARVLTRVPRSVLRLKSRGLGDVGTAADIRRRFEACGVAPARIQLDGRLVGVTEHLGLYRRVDVALDPFPYAGTTTTCEALWMGVPVVTLEGVTHAGRVGASLLTGLGRPEWIARAPEAYVERAVALAADVPQRVGIRAGLRDQMWRSPLCDGADFAREWTRALQGMWRERCAREGRE